MGRPAQLREREALLTAAESPAVFKAGAIVAAATVAGAAAILVPRYGARADTWALAAQIALLSGAALSGGFVLRLEQRLQSRHPRLPVVVFYPLVFLAFLFGLLAVYPSAPGYLATARLLNVSLVMPPVVLIVLTVAFGSVYRAVFFHLLPRFTRVDHIKHLSSPEFADQFRIYWDAAARYGDPVTLIMMRSVPRSWSSAADIETATRELERTITPHLRRSDRCGRYARDTVWIVLARTNAALAEIPVRRLLEQIQRDQEFQQHLQKSEVVIRCGVASYQRRMQAPQDLAEAALVAVQEAARKEREVQFFR